MIRAFALFALLFAAAAACLALLPGPARVSAPPPSAHEPAQAATGGAPALPEVRVVYPAPAGGAVTTAAAIPPRAPPEAVPSPAPPPPVPPASPAASSSTPAASAIVPPPAAGGPVQPPAQNININTASVEALNGIVGAGRIGRTIVEHRPYRSVEDLLTKRVVRKGVYEKIKGQVATE